MITFKQFISEEPLTEAVVKKWFMSNIDVNTAMSVLNSSAKDGLKAIKNDGLIYRGFDSPGKNKADFKALDSSSGLRTSRDSDNLYQAMMDQSEELSGYPSRSNSFICSTDKHVADGYGRAFVMVPLDGTKIAFASKSDIFKQDIKSSIMDRKPDEMYQVSKFLQMAGVKREKYEFRSPGTYDAVLANFTPAELTVIWDEVMNDLVGIKFTGETKDIARKLNKDLGFGGAPLTTQQKKTVADLAKVLEAGEIGGINSKTATVYELFKSNPQKCFTALSTHIMNPSTLKLRLGVYGEPVPSNVECWFSGKCIAISYDVFGQILLRLKEQKFPIASRILTQWKWQLKQSTEKEREKALDDDDDASWWD